jgi:hypothetical protein
MEFVPDDLKKSFVCLQLLTWVFFYYAVVSLNPSCGEVCLIQHYVIKFVSDLQQIGGKTQ